MDNWRKYLSLFNISNAILIVGVAMALYHLISSQYLIFGGYKHQNVHLLFAFLLVFLLDYRDKPRRSKIITTIAILLSIVCTLYVGIFYDELELRAMFNTKIDILIGVILIVLVLEATRRAFGLILPSIAGLAIIYCTFGYLIPGPLKAMQVSLTKIIPSLSIGFKGIYGSILAISANYIFLFVFFGAMLQVSGATEFFMIIGKIAGRKFRAGPAMSAVVSSAFVGSTTGSIGANIATTGSFTIPLMKRVGYTNEQAGAIEAAASSGGQIMPPVMGAAAFAMAGITGEPYLHIVVISIIPALIYFGVLGLYTQFQAAKADLPHLTDFVDVREMVLRAPLFIVPISIIIYLLVVGRTLMFSAFWGIMAVFIISTIRKKTRASLKKWCDAFVKGSSAAAQIALSAACIGIVVQTLMLSGMGVKLPGLVDRLSGGNFNLALFIIMIISIILGMGVTTLAVYILVAMITAPVLVKMGVPLLSAHFFVFYFACFSMLTPPIGMGSVIASKLAGGDYLKTAIEAVKASIAGFIVPFLIIWNPVLLLAPEGSILLGVIRLITCVMLVIAIEALCVNYYLTSLQYYEIILLVISALSSIIYFIYQFNFLLVLGILLFITVTILQYYSLKRIRTRKD
jgi:TRAP transporter 4TM/12TM fusion protein